MRCRRTGMITRTCRCGVERGVWFAGGYLSDRGYRGAFGRDAKEGGSGTGVEGGGVDSVLLILNFRF